MWILLVPLFITGTVLHAQNQVQNPSFEDFEQCPDQLGNFNGDVKYWSSPTIGSTDYFNTCNKSVMGAPKNFNGVQPADFGEGYVGLYLYAPGDYREYVQAALKRPLEKGRTYRLSFYVSLAERSDVAVKEFGILFSNEQLNISTRKVLSKMLRYKEIGNKYQYLEIGYSNFYADTRDWILVHTEFVAKGFEKYLIIGNFKNNARTRTFKTKQNPKQGAYYYMDLVLVEPTSGSLSEPDGKMGHLAMGDAHYEVDTVHVFKNVLFDFDKYGVLDASVPEIRAVANYLDKNPHLNITINGHTDNVGSDGYNDRLSTHRARSVADYLAKLGIDVDRIAYKGHGGKKPMTDNATEEGRQRNRRVEFVITRN
ncbi:MAG: OmpA family protein [Flavobacteriaceae bacterium]